MHSYKAKFSILSGLWCIPVPSEISIVSKIKLVPVPTYFCLSVILFKANFVTV